MEWLNRAADLNKTGAVLCNQGKEVEALEYFRGALELLSILAKGFQDTTFSMTMWPSAPLLTPTKIMCSKANQSCNSPPTILSSLQQSQPKEEEEEESPPPFARALPSASDRDEGLLFVYRRALLFKPTTWVDTDRLSCYIAIIEFNMGLAIHLQSRTGGEKALLDALHVYDHCLGHINRIDTGFSVESSQVLFAALNNKAAIFYEFCSFQNSRQVLEALLNAITCSKNTGVLNEIKDEDLEGFLFNAMLMKGASVAPSA